MYLNISEIATELRLTRKTIYELIHSGDLGKYVSKVGGRYRISQEKLQQFVDDAVVAKD